MRCLIVERVRKKYPVRFLPFRVLHLKFEVSSRKTRTVEITQRLAGAIRERRKRTNSKALFVNRKGKPDQHLLRKLQNLAEKAGAEFHADLHKLRKTGASRRYIANVPLPTLRLELGHESLAVTHDHLADVRKPGEAKKAVAEADFVPKSKIVETGTDSD